MVVHYIQQFLNTTFAAFWMALVLYLTPDINICHPGEFVFNGWDVCVSLLGGSDKESGLTGFFQRQKEELEEEAEKIDEGEVPIVVPANNNSTEPVEPTPEPPAEDPVVPANNNSTEPAN